MAAPKELLVLRANIEPNVNVEIVARERGKKVPGLCRSGHNIWTNVGRQYLAEVISPKDATFANHYNEPPIQIVKYMGMGIGGDSQAANIAADFPTLNTDYPGQNLQSEQITVSQLERPIRVSGSSGTGAAIGDWMLEVSAPPSPVPTTKVEFVTLFGLSDFHLAGAYPSVPLSEIGLFLSTQTKTLSWDTVYDLANPPSFVNVGGRQVLVAYNTFDTITKTTSVSLEIHWEIQF
jgi:hypothetical protein